MIIQTVLLRYCDSFLLCKICCESEIDWCPTKTVLSRQPVVLVTISHTLFSPFRSQPPSGCYMFGDEDGILYCTAKPYTHKEPEDRFSQQEDGLVALSSSDPHCSSQVRFHISLSFFSLPHTHPPHPFN